MIRRCCKETIELGFAVSLTFRRDLDEQQQDRWWDEFIAQAIEAKGLRFGGGGDNKQFAGFVTAAAGTSAAEINRQQIAAWLAARPEVRVFTVGPLVDARCDDE